MSLSILTKFNVGCCFVIIIEGLVCFQIDSFLIQLNSLMKILLFILIVSFVFSIFSWIINFWWLFFFGLFFFWLCFCLFFWWWYFFIHFRTTCLFLFFLFVHILHELLKVKIIWHSSLGNNFISFFNFWVAGKVRIGSRIFDNSLNFLHEAWIRQESFCFRIARQF